MEAFYLILGISARQSSPATKWDLTPNIFLQHEATKIEFLLYAALEISTLSFLIPAINGLCFTLHFL